MIKAISIFVSLSLLYLFVFTTVVNAHPGRTASDGCHYCRTNCDSWGVAWNERHCHGGGQAEPTSTPYPTWTPRPLPTWTPKPTKIPTPTKVITKTPTRKPTKKVIKKKVTRKSTPTISPRKSFLQSLFGI